MRLFEEGQYPSADPGEQTVPMQAIPAPAPAARRAPGRPRPSLLQSVYYLVATLVLLGGTIGGLAMHFGWWGLDTLFDGAVQRTGAAPSARLTPTTGRPLPPAAWLAQDAFARADQPLWGRASDGMVWGGDANSSAAFAIQAGAGTITGGVGFFTAVLGPGEADAEVVVSASLTRFDGGRDNIGAVVRLTSTSSYYKAFLDGSHLVIMKRIAGVGVTLAAVPFAARDGVAYSIRFQARGTELLARAWPSGSAEPGGWMVAASDGSLSAGQGGLRALLEQGVQVRVFSFSERAVGGGT